MTGKQVPGHLMRQGIGTSNRREFLATTGGALAGMSLLGLAACSDDDDGGSSGGGGEVILSIPPFFDDTGNATKQVKRFNDQHPDGPTIKLRVMPEDTSEYFAQLRTQFQAGGGEIDTIAGDVIWPPQFAQPGWISDLSERFPAEEQKKFLPGTIEAMIWEDKIYGVPCFTDCGLLYYRQDLLEKAGFSEPPQTWDELTEMASKVQADEGIKNGFVFTGDVYEGGTVLGTEFIRNAGGDILDGDTVTIGSPEAIEALTFQQSLVADGLAPEAVANYQEDQAAAAFMRGDSVFMRMWPFYYTWLADPELSTLKESQVGLAPVPVASSDVDGTNVGGGWNYYINAGADDQDAAWEVVEYMTAPEQQLETAIALSQPPTRTEVLEDEALQELPAVRLAKDAILATTTPPVSPYYSDMSLVMAEQFNANVLGEVSPDEAAETLQGELESIIERGG